MLQKIPLFVDVAEGTQHSMGRTADGDVFSWGRTSSMGQLGRGNTTESFKNPGQVPLPKDVKAARVFVSNHVDPDSGHSAILDHSGKLWMAGCDRWQQLGLGSSHGGAAGYTWQGGKQWQDRFMLNHFVTELMSKENCAGIRDVALGGDHTLVLSSNRQSVYAYGKGGDGQLGFVGKPFVSAPKRSTHLSGENIAAVCAVQSCSITIDDNGAIKAKAGRCRNSQISEGLSRCIANAKRHRLLSDAN